MLQKIKKELINNPEKLKNVLEYFGYCNIAIRQNYMQFGRDADSSRKSIVIRLEKNDWLYVIDYPKNINMDLFSYIISQRDVKFIDVLNVIKSELGISDYYSYFDEPKKCAFGGFYNRIKKRNKQTDIIIYDESILDDYIKIPNEKFLKDNISIKTQNKFDIRYDTISQSIIIPIYDQLGQLMGVKARINKIDSEIKEDEQKYYYVVSCQASRTLYGYAQNYEHLVENVVYIYEAEKSVQQCDSYGYHNCVALASGTLSKDQAKMILGLNPTKVIFMHDVGYKLEFIMRNIETIKNMSTFQEIQFGYWDYFNKGYDEDKKPSPSDFGKEKLDYIINNEIHMLESDTDEEDI